MIKLFKVLLLASFVLVHITVLASYKVNCTISYYCHCNICCGRNAKGITASGKKVKVGMFACNFLPFGTKVRIAGKTYTVEDRGSVKLFGTMKKPKYRIDIFVNSHQEALDLGISLLSVEIIK